MLFLLIVFYKMDLHFIKLEKDNNIGKGKSVKLRYSKYFSHKKRTSLDLNEEDISNNRNLE